MNILGIDFGSKNIGLAWVNTEFGAVLPYGVIKTDSQQPVVNSVVKLVKEEKIEKIVIGLPMSLKDGAENKNTERIRGFAEEIKKQTDVPVEFMNEMFSSQQADRMGDGVSRDEKSAMIILEDYLTKFKK